VKELTEAGGRQISPAGLAAPAAFIAVSAVFHYLGPAFAVLLFARLDPFGVTWLRIAGAALVFAVWRRPWRLLRRLTAAQRRALLALGVVLAVMNTTFYLAIARLPLATVGSCRPPPRSSVCSSSPSCRRSVT
jgi:inner membrane transporter RhtA